jgi:hypothetical protein
MLLVLLAMTGWAMGQVVASGGMATYGSPYAQSNQAYIPMLATPIMDLNISAPPSVGASNATPGLIAGATNSTLSNPAPPAGAVTADEQYSISGVPNLQIPSGEGYENEGFTPEETMEQEENNWPSPVMNLGPGGPPSAYNLERGQPSLAQRAAEMRIRQGQVAHVYTNEDIARIDHQNPPQTINTGPDGISIVPLKPRSEQHGVAPSQPPQPAPPANQTPPQRLVMPPAA